MKKILFIITKEDVGGAQKYVSDLGKHLDPDRFQVRVITGGREGIRFLSNAFLPYILFLNDWFAVFETYVLLKRTQPDIVHLNSSKAGVVGALAVGLHNKFARKKQIKTVFTAHGWVFNPDNQLSRLRRLIYVLIHRFAASMQDKIITVSEYDRKLALKFNICREEKLITIHNGLDYETLRFLGRHEARKVLLPRPHKVDTKEIWIGSIGRLVIEKHYEDFVEAAALVENQDVKFFIIGSGYEYQKIQKRIKKHRLSDRFFIVTNMAPAAPYLKAFDVFVLSSIKEGLPYTLLEAMAAQLPVIATRTGGMTEIVESRGLVMPPREPSELARAISYYLDNKEKAEASAKTAHEYLKANLTLKKTVRQTENVYQNISNTDPKLIE